MVDFKEALAALSDFTYGEMVHMNAGAARMVRVALEAAQQEAEAWESVQAWLTADVVREFMICRVAAGFKAYPRYGYAFEKIPIFDAHDSARAALLECAAWCRAQVSRAETKGCRYHAIDMHGCSSCDRKNGRVRA